MDPCFPVFVGITGKRDLEGHQDEVSKCLNEIFDDLDERLPDTPKVLVAGMAVGADLLAVKTLFARSSRNWLVLAVLPFARDHFENDFAKDPAALDLLRQTLDDSRTRTYELPLLRLANGAEACLEDINSRAKDLSPTLLEARAAFRRRHYEQVGMWIAQTANILIAVMPAGETPDKVGGTARVVDFRLNGRPYDDLGHEIVVSSAAIARPSALKRVVGGFVWLVDPWQSPGHRKRGLPINIWQPREISATSEAAYYVNALRRFIRHGGFLDEKCRVSWVPPDLPGSIPRPQAVLDIEHFIAVEPPSGLLGTYANDVAALSSTLKEYGLISVLGTVEKRKDEAQDIRDFSCQFLASRRGGAVELITPGIVIDMPSTLFALRFSPLVLRIDGLIHAGVARSAIQRRKRRRLAQMLTSFERNLWFQIAQERPPGDPAKFSFVTMDQLPGLLRKLKVIPRRRRQRG